MKNVYQVQVIDLDNDDRIIEYSEIYTNYDDADAMRSKWTKDHAAHIDITVTIKSFALIEKVSIKD